MECRIVSYAVPDPRVPLYANGPLVAQAVCQTHSWTFPAGQLMTDADNRCPIGRIEAATDDALAKINRGNS